MIGSIYNRQDFKDFFFTTMNIVDLLSFVPFYLEICLYYIFKYTLGEDSQVTLTVMNLQILGVFRVLRLIRLFSLSKHSAKVKLLVTAMQKSLDLLVSVLFFIGSAVVISGTLIYYAERGTFDHTTKQFVHILEDGTTEPSQFSNVLIGMWYALISVTTVGYGDFAPVSSLGRVIAGVSILVGMLFIALPSLIIGRTYSEVLHQYEMEKAHMDYQQKAKQDEDFTNNIPGGEIEMKDLTEDATSTSHVNTEKTNTTSKISAFTSVPIVNSSTETTCDDLEYDKLDQASLFKLLEEQDKLLEETAQRIQKTRLLIKLAQKKASIFD